MPKLGLFLCEIAKLLSKCWTIFQFPLAVNKTFSCSIFLQMFWVVSVWYFGILMDVLYYFIALICNYLLTHPKCFFIYFFCIFYSVIFHFLTQLFPYRWVWRILCMIWVKVLCKLYTLQRFFFFHGLFFYSVNTAYIIKSSEF